VFTDERGEYSISVPEGNYNVRVYLKGFAMITYLNRSVREGKTESFDFKLEISGFLDRREPNPRWIPLQTQ
jgi:hypothetical protein